MQVSQIIRDKGGDVVTAAAESTLADAARVLADRRIGAIVVMEGDSLRGILSERDVVRALARHGAAALDKTVAEFMTSKVITCNFADTVDVLMEKMTSGRFRHLPVMEEGRLAGIISIGDVVKRRIEEVQLEAAQIREFIASA